MREVGVDELVALEVHLGELAAVKLAGPYKKITTCRWSIYTLAQPQSKCCEENPNGWSRPPLSPVCPQRGTRQSAKQKTRFAYMTSSKKKKMNLTIGVRSRRRVVPRVQVWIFWVRIRWRVRISVRFGSVGSEYRVDGLGPRFQSGDVTRDCG